MSEYFNVGKIVAAYGVEGQMILFHDMGKEDAFKDIQVIFMEEKKESFIPYFIESTRIKNNKEIYLKLEGINTREKVLVLLQKKIYLDEVHFRKAVSPRSVLFYLGFEVQDRTEGILGRITEVIESPAQLLFKVDQNGRELLIPINAETLQRVNGGKKIVHVILPDGLLDVYKK